VLDNYSKWPIGYLVPVVVIGSLGYLYFAHKRGNEKGAFLASCAYIVGMLAGAAFAIYPNVLASTGQQYSLTIYNTAAGEHGLSVGLVWWTLGMIFAIGYFIFIYHMFRGKVKLGEGDEHGY
jgi:cytochrome d ubiquinol oxidase subunit II